MVVLSGLVVAAALFARWWMAPIDIPRPQRPPEPADNAYEVYRSLAVYSSQVFRSDPWTTFAERLIFATRAQINLEQPEWVRYLLQKVKPIRQEYRQHLSKPCVVIVDYTPGWTFPELAEFRRWAGCEALDIAVAVQERDYVRAIDNYRTVLLLSEQIRNQGSSVHYFTAIAMQSVVNQQMSQALPHLSAEICDKLVEVVREWERRRVPLSQVISAERGYYLSSLHDLYAGNLSALRLAAEHGAIRRWNPRLFNLRRAAREGEAYFHRLQKEWSKPVSQQTALQDIEHPIGRILLGISPGLPRSAAYTEVRIRLLACAAGVRTYRLRRGAYPLSLSEAGVADLAKDPFTGGALWYRAGDADFFLYSFGEDGNDDHGWRVAERGSPRGDGDVALLPFDGPPLAARFGVEKGEPLRLK